MISVGSTPTWTTRMRARKLRWTNVVAPDMSAYAHRRTVRLVDGPREVHRNAIAKIEPAKRAAVR